MSKGHVRVSVANLATYVKNAVTGEVTAVGIINEKKLQKGEILLQSLGGGAKMSTHGKSILVDAFDATFAPEGDETSDDARFTIDESQFDMVLALFKNLAPDFCELDPLREVKEEFKGNLGDVKSELLGVFRQESAEDGTGTSERASKDVPTRRLFYVHCLILPDDVYQHFLAHESIRSFTGAELDTTAMGRTKGKTGDGYTMADNLCNYVPRLLAVSATAEMS